VIENVGSDHQLVGAGAADEIIEAAPRRIRPADDRASIRVMKDCARVMIEPCLEILERRRHPARPAEPVVQRRLLQ